jgi:GNAT superfamily N-acetyltransferase
MVSRLFVASRARGAEVGVDLLQTVVREASARGLRTALDVAESDRAARALHERCGWQHVDSTPWTWSGGGRTVLHCFSVQR